MIFSLHQKDFRLPKHFEEIYKTLKKRGILGEYLPRYNFPDEPQFYQYVCERRVNLPHVKTGYGYGSSENKTEAITTAIAEAVEHYCILYEREDRFIKDSYANLQKGAIDPMLFSVFTGRQLQQKQFKQYVFTKNTVFNWTRGFSLVYNKPVFVPAQLVFANYKALQRGEPIIRHPISTGAACGPTKEFATYRGILEVIERDAYMISYLNRLKQPIITISKDDNLYKFVKRIERYNLKILFVQTTLDFSVHSVIAVIQDDTGVGPAVSVGLGANLQVESALKTAALEATRRHIGTRDRFFRSKSSPLPSGRSIDSFLLRKQLLWAAPHMRNVIKDFLRGPRVRLSSLKNLTRSNDQENLKFLLKQLKTKGYDVIAVDVTTKDVKSVGLCVMKILIPQLLPLYHDERSPYKKNFRLYNIPIRLGMKSKMLDEDTLNPSHPF